MEVYTPTGHETAVARQKFRKEYEAKVASLRTALYDAVKSSYYARFRVAVTALQTTLDESVSFTTGIAELPADSDIMKALTNAVATYGPKVRTIEEDAKKAAFHDFLNEVKKAGYHLRHNELITHAHDDVIHVSVTDI